MKELLQALQHQIATEVNYLAAKSVHLLADELALPETTPFPCVGLKDGPVTTHYALGGQAKKRTLSVDIVCFVEINAPEGVIIGQGSDQPGILDLVDAVKAAAEGFCPTDNYRWPNGNVDETASQMIALGDDLARLAQKKTITMTWTKAVP